MSDTIEATFYDVQFAFEVHWNNKKVWLKEATISVNHRTISTYVIQFEHQQSIQFKK